MPSLVIGTAGHIDHGKSALVKALSGTDPDRLKEEQARGITIDLGFAHLRLGDLTVAFVDVPGHERFVRNMLAGAGGLDAVMLVVAADESVKPQTREHFEICRLLGIARGLVVLSKADLADAETIDLVALEVRELVAGSFLDGAPVIPVSARTGAGLEPLRHALSTLATEVPLPIRPGVVRLPVDRVFTMKGFGTVVTGTLVSGRIREGDAITVMGHERTVRVRGLQAYGRPMPQVDAPSRVALNLGGVDANEIARGVTLASEGSLAVTRRFDARIEVLASARPLRHGSRVRVHQGTADILGRVAVCAVRSGPADDWRPATPGDTAVAVPAGSDAFVRVRLDRSAVLTRLDRVVLRACSPPMTIGGGVVLDPQPPPSGVRRPATLARFRRLDPGTGLESAGGFVDLWLEEAAAGGVASIDLVRRGGLAPEAAEDVLHQRVAAGQAVRAGDRAFAGAVIDGLEQRLCGLLAAYHRAHPAESGMAREAAREAIAPHRPPAVFDVVLARLEAAHRVEGRDRLALTSHQPASSAADDRVRDLVEAIVRQAGLTPPDLATLSTAAAVPPASLGPLVQVLIRDGRLARLGVLLFHPDVLGKLKVDVKAMSAVATAGRPVTVDVATFKTRFGLSRKYAIPLLEWLDRERVTRRVGEARIVL
jgi:selenocysteine-specific elongation factor